MGKEKQKKEIDPAAEASKTLKPVPKIAKKVENQKGSKAVAAKGTPKKAAKAVAAKGTPKKAAKEVAAKGTPKKSENQKTVKAKDAKVTKRKAENQKHPKEKVTPENVENRKPAMVEDAEGTSKNTDDQKQTDAQNAEVALKNAISPNRAKVENQKRAKGEDTEGTSKKTDDQKQTNAQNAEVAMKNAESPNQAEAQEDKSPVGKDENQNQANEKRTKGTVKKSVDKSPANAEAKSTLVQAETKPRARWFKIQTQEDNKNSDGEKVGGLIFMCNPNTKPDCFRYKVLGLPSGNRQVVMGIKPGLNLFLYDFGNKILHGVYKASSAGGMDLVPAAFDGRFPAQVRFEVFMDCLPLPESVFKEAIKDNYYDKQRFKTELTADQVEKLKQLFSTARPAETNAHGTKRQTFGTLAKDPYPIKEFKRPYMVEHERGKQVRSYGGSRDLRSSSGREYQTYGLGREPSSGLPRHHGPTISGPPLPQFFDRYSKPAEDNLNREGRRVVEVERVYSGLAADRPPPEHSRIQQLGGRSDPASMPVSSRYSFEGPLASNR